jgi:outer membrane receptor protein involved in Fe transport
VEAGADWVGERTRVSLTAYRNSLDALITNVTRSVTPQQITRQRDNAGAAVARGVEARLVRRLGPVSLESAYLFADSRTLAGQRIPQVAKQQGSAQVTYERGGNLISAGVRASGLQFEDDLNAYILPGYAVLHLTARRTLPHGLALQLQVENLLNREVVAGYSPTPLIGAPRLIRAGVRWTVR